MSPTSYQSLLEIVLGFCVAGALASAYQVLERRPPSFRLLGTGYGRLTMSAMPFVIFAAPFIIMRNMLRRSSRDRIAAGQRFAFAMLATIITGLWSLLSGSLFLMGLQLLGVTA